jgi:cation:H+ antiporter
MIWVVFVGWAIVIVIAAIKLAQYGDVIALRTGLGGLFVGTLLMAGATSLPELLTGLSSISQDVPDLAAGNIFGSSMFNMFMLAILDMMNQQYRVLRKIAVSHALTASLAILLTGAAVFFIEAEVDLSIGWLGADSLLLIGLYYFGTRIIHTYNRSLAVTEELSVEDYDGVMPLWRAGIGFLVATVVLILVTPQMVKAATEIAEQTGLSTGFVGLALVAIVTSLPELTTTIAASRIGAFDLAVGNLFGSNIFNIFALGVTDAFYTRGLFLSDLDRDIALSGLLALLLTSMALVGNLSRVERRLIFIEIDALLIMLIYILGLLTLYERGLVG